MKNKVYAWGFSMIELLVVISVIGILSVVLFENFSGSTEVSRDAQRQADLRALQAAIELYKNENGRYPEGCNGPGAWSGQKGTDYECGNNSGQYIVGLAPKYIKKLPTDPKLNGDNSGYIYVTNDEGSSFKMMVKNTVEAEEVDVYNPLKSCDYFDSVMAKQVECDPPGGSYKCDVYICDHLYVSNSYAGENAAAPNECQDWNTQFKKSYAVWGGWATPNSVFIPGTMQYTANVERRTEEIWCKI